MLPTTFMSTLLLLSSFTYSRAAVPSDTPAPLVAADTPIPPATAVADAIAAALGPARNPAQARRNVNVGPWSQRDSTDAKSTFTSADGIEVVVKLHQTSRREILSRAESRKKRIAEQKLRAELAKEMRERQVAKRTYAVLSGRVYNGPAATIFPLLEIANQTLAQCGAACTALARCNQFDLSGTTQRPARQCNLFNAVVTGSQVVADYQSAYLGTCAATYMTYGFPLSSCKDTLL